MKVYKLLPIVAIVFCIAACEQEDAGTATEPVVTTPSLNLNFRFQVDGSVLEFDTIKYENDAHNYYSVHTMMFYLSQISLITSDSAVVQIKDWIYVDARSAGTLDISIKNIPKGCYTGMSFNIGIDSVHNIADGLPATPDNLAMEWPSAMGGGYHFLKLEGYFADSASTPGFAMHLGTNACLTLAQITGSLCFDNSEVSRTMIVNVNEWFRTPTIYDFNIDGNYIMGNTQAMTKIASNGADVFTIQ